MSLGTMRSKASRKHSRINRLTRSCHGWKYISSLGIVRNHGGPRESLPVDLVWVTNRRLIFPYRLEPLFFFFSAFFFSSSFTMIDIHFSCSCGQLHLLEFFRRRHNGVQEGEQVFARQKCQRQGQGMESHLTAMRKYVLAARPGCTDRIFYFRRPTALRCPLPC